MKETETIKLLKKEITFVIGETGGITLKDTIELLKCSHGIEPSIKKLIFEFDRLLGAFHNNDVDIKTLFEHPFSKALFHFFKEFPLPYHEEHIHLTGSLEADFIWPRLKTLLEGPNKKIYEEKIKKNYGKSAWPITGPEKINDLIRLKEGGLFENYLKILYLPKLIFINKKAYEDAAWHMASTLYNNYNVGTLRLKFTLSRMTSMKLEQIPGVEKISEEDVIIGLYKGFKKFKKTAPNFNFILSPCFRKEKYFFDNVKFNCKKDHIDHQVKNLIKIIEKHEHIKEHLTDVDTVGDEKELYRKKHFLEMKDGLRKLQQLGISIRSHHGETWKNLRKGIQSVDNAMNIWRIDTLEHGLSLGINPNYYFHRLYQQITKINKNKIPLQTNSLEYAEIMDMNWQDESIKSKLIDGTPLNQEEKTEFIKTKFFTAQEIEQYQHDVLNRMIDKQVGVVALPTSNMRLTGTFPNHKDHPFSWWEKKGVTLGVGTDNYIALSTNFIQEMLILLYSDAENLKIMKLLMVASKENRRSYISHLLWRMRQEMS